MLAAGDIMAARIKVKPARQGQLDGACGFYAITNAIHLLEPELSPPEIFRSAWQNFLADGDPMRILDGTNRGSLKKILSRTINKINASYNLTDQHGNPYEFKFSIPFWQSTKERSRDIIINTLKSACHKNGTVAIIGYEYSYSKQHDGYAHWTVIRDSDFDGIVTHDSSGEKRKIPFDEMRIDSFNLNSHISRPYNIYSSDIFLINAVSS